MTQCLFVSCYVALAAFWAEAAPATSTPIAPPQAQASEDYKAVLDWRRITTQLDYMDPNQPLPSLSERLREPVQGRDREPVLTIPGGMFRILILTALAVLVVFLWQITRGQLVRFADTSDGGSDRQPAPGATTAPQQATAPGSLGDIRANPDLRAATIALLGLALRRASDHHGLRLHPSWTARDVLTRLPDHWPHKQDFATLVRAAEQAHFGNYPVTETGFTRSLAAAERILAPEQPA